MERKITGLQRRLERVPHINSLSLEVFRHFGEHLVEFSVRFDT